MHPNIIDDFEPISTLLKGVKRIAVLGIKADSQPEAPAHYVPKFLVEMGFDVVPVPVYFPEVTTILGRPVYRKVADVPTPPLLDGTRTVPNLRPIDLVNVFRRSQDLMPHLDDIVRAKPKAVWLQQQIRDDDFATKLAEAGITVVQDRCLMVELRLRQALLRDKKM
jgi:predicted CoA-binding protein